MKTRVAIVTGASSGMGEVFARTAPGKVEFDEMWVIARREDRLKAMAEEMKGQTKVVPIAMDLAKRENIAKLKEKIEAEDVDIRLLVNAAGFGKFQAVMDVDMATADNMMDLNCGAMMDMCYICLPHMSRGSMIMNLASVAAFQPVPYETEYAATKAFVLLFSRGLWKELRSKGITVTALCPYWTNTEFFNTAQTNSEKDVVHYFNAMYDPKDVVARGWRDMLKGRDVSTYGFTARLQLLGVKLLPHRLAMTVWCNQQKIKD